MSDLHFALPASREAIPDRERAAPQGTAAVVAPFSAGSFYAAEFSRRGWSCVTVVEEDESTPPLYRNTMHKDDFDAIILHTGDVDRTAARLRELGVAAIVAGTEIGVPLADTLAAELGLPGNDPATSSARRDKGAMVSALQAAGVPSIPTLHTGDLAEALEWAHDVGTRSYVLKPADSAGNDGVAFCRSRADLEAAWHALHGRANLMGGSNELLVLQQQVFGTQYIVNTVSAAGWHVVTDIWADHRIQTPAGVGVYDRTMLLSPERDAQLYELLASYTRRAITALGVQYGPGHSEVMLTDAGPILIETGARPEGPISPAAVTRATGTYQVRVAVDAIVDPRSTLDRAPRVLQDASRVTLRAPFDGIIDPAGWKALLDVPGVAGTLEHVTGGSEVRTTVDLVSSPDSIFLVGDQDTIERGYAAIRQLESDGSLYLPAVDR